MSEYNGYKCIEFDGTSLFPSFSIYLFEITKKDDGKCFYVGMTGDNHYPSARSILHRLAGHIDLLQRSNQSQFIKAIRLLFKKEKNEYLSKAELSSLSIKLHHWPIDGFTKWEGEMKNINKESTEYKAYIKKQERILELENKIIFDFKKSGKLLNKTLGKDSEMPEEDFLIIYNAIKKIAS